MVQINDNSLNGGGSQETILSLICSICITISMIIGIIGIKLKKFRFRQSLNFDLIQNESDNGYNYHTQFNRRINASHSILSSQNDELMRGVFRIRNDDDHNLINRPTSQQSHQTFLIRENSQITEEASSSRQHFHNENTTSKISNKQQQKYEKNIKNIETVPEQIETTKKPSYIYSDSSNQLNSEKEINLHKQFEMIPNSILVTHQRTTQNDLSKVNSKRYQKVRIRSPPVTPTKLILTEIFPHTVQQNENISNQFPINSEQKIKINLPTTESTSNSDLKDDKNNFSNDKVTRDELHSQFNEQSEQFLNQISDYSSNNSVLTFKSSDSEIRPPVPKPRKNYLLDESIISSEINESTVNVNVINVPKPKPRSIKNYNEDIEKNKSVSFENENIEEKEEEEQKAYDADDFWSDIHKHRYLTKEAKINKIKKGEDQGNIHMEESTNENHKLNSHNIQMIVVEKPKTLRDMKKNQKISETGGESGIKINLHYDSSIA